MDFSVSSAAVLLFALIIVSLTASCLTAMTVYGVRRQQPAGELLGELILISIGVPTLLMLAATRLPPELFRFLP